jgi:retron-type reverse transcriptase
MYSRLTSFFDKFNIISPCQFGFRKGRSTEQALVQFTDYITYNLDAKLSVLSLFLDISKAFDSIDHSILIDKLFMYGIRGVALDWFSSYLTNRRQYVILNGSSSNLASVSHGIPQGSILGPLLFLIYINDLPKVAPEAHFILFADDTTVLLPINNKAMDNHSVPQNVVNKIALWFNNNRLRLNIIKTHAMLFSLAKIKIDCPVLKLQDTLIAYPSTIKFLVLLMQN